MRLEFDSANNTIALDGDPVSLHCHHYNCGLLKTIEDIPGIDGPALFARTAAEEVFQVFRKRYLNTAGETPPEETLARASELYSFMGFGKIDLARAGARGGVVRASSSYFVTAWLAKYGRRQTPLCHFTCGFITGVLAAVFRTVPEAYRAAETGCMIQGRERCEFLVSRVENGG